MTQPSKTVLVVPCYNEAQRLDVEAFRAYASTASCTRFLMVDDGSTDNTRRLLDELAAFDREHFHVLTLDRNRGKAEAVRRGMLQACQGHPAYVGFWDADLSTPLDEIAGFREVLDRNPGIRMVFGARVNLLGRSVRRNLLRHYIGRAFATVVATLLRLPIYDTQCGAKLFRADDELQTVLAEPFISKWIFDVEIIARYAKARGDSAAMRQIIFEIPLMSWYDVQGSKIRMRDFFVVLSDLARIFRRYLR